MRNLLILCFIFCHWQAAFACSVSGATTSDISVSMESVTIDNHPAPGDVIATKEITVNPSATWTIDCTAPVGSDLLTFALNLPYIGNNTYKTNVNGIGIRVSLKALTPLIRDKEFHYLPAQIKIDKSGSIHPNELKMKVELLRTTDSLTPGQLSVALPDFATLLSSGTKSVNHLSALNVSGQINLPTCAWASPATHVELGNFTFSDFHKNYAQSVTQAKDFALTINCPSSPDLDITVRGDNNGNVGNVLAIRDISGSALGVGIQIIHENTVVQLNNKLHLALNGDDANGNVVIPFSARLIKTQAKMKPGSIYSVATFDLSYE